MSEQATTATQSTNEVAPAAVATESIATGGKLPEAVVDAAPAKDAATETKSPEPKTVPEKYEFKTPEGSLLKQADIDKIAALAKERGLSQDEAQKVLEEKSQEKSSFVEEQRNEFKNIRTNWQQQFLKDPEIGGDNAKASAENAKRFIEKYASPELKHELNVTGFGDHPELIRLMARAGKAMAEDKLVLPGKHSSADSFDAKDVLYPSMKKKTE